MSHIKNTLECMGSITVSTLRANPAGLVVITIFIILCLIAQVSGLIGLILDCFIWAVSGLYLVDKLELKRILGLDKAKEIPEVEE